MDLGLRDKVVLVTGAGVGPHLRSQDARGDADLSHGRRYVGASRPPLPY
jgi:hypothetical protein